MQKRRVLQMVAIPKQKWKLTAFSFELTGVVKRKTTLILELLSDGLRRYSCKGLARNQGNKENRWEDLHVGEGWFGDLL
jgi:hypothetical protein